LYRPGAVQHLTDHSSRSGRTPPRALHPAVAARRRGAGHTGTWALFLLSQHPAAEAALAAELDAAGLLATAARPAPRRLQWADLGRLPYLQAVIKARRAARPPGVLLHAL